MAELLEHHLNHHPLHLELWNLRHEGIQTDLMIVTKNGMKVHAHKAILAFKHPTLKSVLTDNTDVIVATDFDTKEILDDLKLLYLDKDSRKSHGFQVFKYIHPERETIVSAYDQREIIWTKDGLPVSNQQEEKEAEK